MNHLKEKQKESNKERIRENPPPPMRLRHARSSVLCRGEFKAGDVYAAAYRIDGMTIDEACDWIDYMQEVDWVFANGQDVNGKNFRRSLRMWHRVDARVKAARAAEALMVSKRHKRATFGGVGADYEEIERIKAKVAAEKKAKAMAEDGAWTLCEERCAEFRAEGCVRCRHWSVPPQLRERPVPPEECIHFKAKGE